MKKTLVVLLALVLALGATASFAEGFKLGLHIDAVPSHYISDATADRDGSAQIDATAAAVLVDADGKLVDVMIDEMQAKMTFTAKGELGEGFPTEVKTKLELLEDYNMRPASPIGKEWYEQIDVIGKSLIGKTAAEIRGIELDEKAAPVDEELRAGCTMAVNMYLNAVASAMENATAFDGLNADSKVGLGFAFSPDSKAGYYSSAASADKDGKCMAYTHYAAVAVNDGVITGYSLDSTQATISFDINGKITKTNEREITKKEKKYDYGMVPASPIGKEWFEQVAVWDAYMVGKTIQEVAGLELDEKFAPVDEELRAGCTMDMKDPLAVTVKAIVNAK